MGTRLQKKLAKAIVEDVANKRPTGATQMLENVGYRETTAWHRQKDIFEAVGVTEELVNLGFTVEAADKVVTGVLLDPKAQDKDKLGAADRVYKRYGANAPEKTINTNLNINSSPAAIDKFKKIRERFEDELLKEIGT